VKYPVLITDNPWRYRNVHTGGNMRSGAEATYKPGTDGKATMSFAELCALAPFIERVTHDDSVLLMWATKPLLLDALRCLDAWGFTYKTFLGWDKARFGLGYWFRGQEEILIVALRDRKMTAFHSQMRDVQLGFERAHVEAELSKGQLDAAVFPPSLQRLLVADALITEKRGSHSAKPAWQYDVADLARRDGRCLELFARRHAHITVPEWVDQTGLELDGLDVRTALDLIATDGWQKAA
jgi:N6-adenosine-specific RNA methylase IME4